MHRYLMYAYKIVDRLNASKVIEMTNVKRNSIYLVALYTRLQTVFIWKRKTKSHCLKTQRLIFSLRVAEAKKKNNVIITQTIHVER